MNGMSEAKRPERVAGKKIENNLMSEFDVERAQRIS